MRKIQSYISNIICPAQAGVILFDHEDGIWKEYLSRASGGDPANVFDADYNQIFVPRKRG